jgi:hypothetical protein
MISNWGVVEAASTFGQHAKNSVPWNTNPVDVGDPALVVA